MGKTAFEIAKKSAEIQWIQKLAEHPPKIVWHLKQKAIRSVLGTVVFSKVVSEKYKLKRKTIHYKENNTLKRKMIH